MTKVGRIVSMDEIELTEHAKQQWMLRAAAKAEEYSVSWACKVEVPPMEDGRTRDEDLVLFAKFTNPAGGSLTIEFFVPKSEWRWKGEAH